MVAELKLSKSPDGKFGFRLVGGADFEIPLTVSLVIEGSIAFDSGLREGDVVIRINKTPVNSLTHEEAHKILAGAGNDICLAVLRGVDITPAPSMYPSPAPTVSSPVEAAEEFRFDPAFQRDTSIISDQEIAEVISGEAEVLKGHNVIGVDFRNKMMPQSIVIKQSEVFQTLQQESRKTKEDIEAEQKRWTTFLQKPNRPIPKPKHVEEVKRSTYRPPIVKQPKPLVDPEIQEKLRSVSPSPFTISPAHIPLARATASPEPKYPVEGSGDQGTNGQDDGSCPNEESAGVESPAEPQLECESQQNGLGATETENLQTSESKEAPPSEEQLEMLKQLSQVQRQIEALQALPTTIQATLDALASQINQLLIIPTAPKEQSPPAVKESSPAKEPDDTDLEVQIETEPQAQNQDDEDVEIPEEPNTEHIGPKTEEEAEFIQHEFEEHEEDWQRKSEKEDFERTGDMQADLQAELRHALKQKPKIRKLKSAFGPLTPQERPIFLKGRIWKSPKDAYNEDFIAETISSQAELITGTTLGVNFLKYQKPEKDLSFLRNSETFKLLHGLDGKSPAGIENRPEKVAAAADVERAITPCP